jgi:hypothetical protein
MRELSRPSAWGLLALLSVAHLVAAMLAFAPLSSFVAAASIDSFDYCVLDYQCHIARETWAASGRLWGYDPFFLAGHVQTFLWNSNVFLQVLAVALPFLPIGMVLKLTLVLAALGTPALFYVGWRGFGFERSESLVGALAGVAWFRLTMGGVFWTIGMTTGFLVYPLSFAGLGLLAALLRGRKRGYAILAVAPLALLVHKTAVFTLALPALAALPFVWRRVQPRHLLVAGVAAALTLAVNLFWIVPLWVYREFAAFDPAISFWTNQDPLALWRDLTSPYAKIGIFHRQGWWGDMVFRDLAVVGTLAAMVAERRRAPLWRPLAAMIAAVVVFTYGGSMISAMQPLDPSRYVPYVFLWLSFAATAALVRQARPLVAAAVIGAVLVSLCALPSSGRHFWNQPVLAKPSVELDAMAGWINGLPGQGRVHVETFSSFEEEAPLWNEQFGRVSIKLPTRTKRLLLGGHYSGVFTAYNDVNFFSGRWLGKPLTALTEAELAARLGDYGVEYLLTWSQEADSALAGFGETVERIDAPEGFTGWRVRSPRGLFVQGDGKVEAWDYDFFELLDVTGEEGLAVLSFHWAPTLVCTGAELVPVKRPTDAAPFVGLKNPTAHIVCRNGGVW